MHVNLDIDGMVNSAKNHLSVQMVEFGTLHINNVFVPMDLIGPDIIAFLLKNVWVVNILIQAYKNVYAFLALIGMEKYVYNAQMDGPGISLLSHAHAQLVQFKLEMVVDSNSNAQVVCNGTKIYGDANVHHHLFGMVISVLLILAKMDKFGMKA